MTLLDIAFLRNAPASLIALGCMVPAFVFIAYVLFDDARTARAHREEQTKAGPTPH